MSRGLFQAEALAERRHRAAEAEAVQRQQVLAREIQMEAMQGLPYIPTGAYYSFTALRRNLADRVKGFAIFWGIWRV
jgi:peptide/nickel transport system substrate-binding protein